MSVKRNSDTPWWVRPHPLTGWNGGQYHRGMVLLTRRLRSNLGQGTTEYMLLLSVVAIGAMAAFALFTQRDGAGQSPVQTMGSDLANNYQTGLTNSGSGGMQAE
jgi:hypothetical protein